MKKDYKFTSTKNGIKVLLVPSRSTDLVTTSVIVNVGSIDESAEQSGISHFLEHMAFKGTKKRNSLKISSDVERLGAEMNAFTSHDHTAYFVKGLSKDAGTFIDILGDIICNSKFAEADVETEREIILQEYRKYQDHPAQVSFENLFATAYKGSSLGRKIIGEPDTIENITANDLKAFVASHYCTGNMLIGVAGKFNETEILESIEKHFAKVPQAPGRVGREIPSFNHGGMLVQTRKTEQASVRLMFKAPHFTSADRHKWEVAAELLGGGMSSPLFMEIRERRSLAYSVSAGIDFNSVAGSLTVSGGVLASKVNEFISAVKEVIQGLKTIKSADMERAKNALCVSVAGQFEKPSSKMFSFAEEYFITGAQDLECAHEYIEAVQRVTADDVKKVFKELLKTAPAVSVVGHIKPKQVATF